MRDLRDLIVMLRRRAEWYNDALIREAAEALEKALALDKSCVDCTEPRLPGLIRCEAHAASHGRAAETTV